MSSKFRRALLTFGALSALSGAAGCAHRDAGAVVVAPSPSPLKPSSGPEGDLLEGSKRAWRAARERHPLHFQGVFQAPRDDGRTTIIVTEPPPHATTNDIQQILGADAVGVERWRIGHDGELRDVVAVLPPASGQIGSDELRDRAAALHRYLFHSTYRAQIYDPFAASAPTSALNIDLAVPIGAVYDWVLSPTRRFVSLDGDAVIGRELGAAPYRGVFRAQDLSVSVWAVPARTDLCTVLEDMRNFAIESDLLLGGLRTDSGSLMIGRARSSPLDRVEPLRSEVLLALSAADGFELSQSYQRKNFFAGKLADKRDWAPILLSPELQDTEFGSLLNVTDQMLKGWSLNGVVDYDNFSFYPKPAAWASDKSLADELGGTSLTFNWNTSGSMTGVDWRGALALVNPRTGALPIAYIPEGGGGSNQVARYEDRNQNFFAAQNDPNLVRVVEYTTFFQLAKAFELHAGPSCMPPRARPAARSPGEAFLERLFVDMLAGRAAPQLVTERDENADRAVEVLKQELDTVEQGAGPDGRAEMVHYLAGVSGHSTVAHPHQEVLDYAAQVASNTMNWSAHGAFAKLFDRDAVFKEYQRLSAHAATGYISTPSVVVSRVKDVVQQVLVDGQMVEVVSRMSGGHNLRFVPGVVRVEAGNAGARVLSNGRFEFDATLSSRHLWIEPKAFQRIQKAVQDGRIDADAARIALDDAARTPVSAPRLPPPLRGDPGVGFDVPREPSGKGASPGSVFTIEYVGDRAAMYRGRTPEGVSLEGGSTRGFIDPLAAAVQRSRGKTGGVFLELQSFPEQRAKAFVAEVVGRVSEGTTPRRVVFVSERADVAERFQLWIKNFRGQPSIEVTAMPASGPGALPRYRVAIPKNGGLLLRVHRTLDALGASRIAERVRSIFRSKAQQTLVQRLDAFCDEEKLAVDVSLDEFGAGHDVHVELEAPGGTQVAGGDQPSSG
jgi:hypothetical protein